MRLLWGWEMGKVKRKMKPANGKWNNWELSKVKK